MSKAIAVIAIIALIIGSCALIFGVTIWMTPSKPTEKTITYCSNSLIIYTNPPNTWKIIPDFNTTINLEAGDVVYFSFQTQAQVYAAAAGESRIQVNLMLDDVLVAEPYAELAANSTTDAIRSSIGFQAFKTGLAPGPHNVTIAYIGNNAANFIHLSTFFIQWFPSDTF